MSRMRLRQDHSAYRAVWAINFLLFTSPKIGFVMTSKITGHFVLVWLYVALLWVFPTSVIGQAFFSNIDDLPIAPGLFEASGDGVSFESSGIRIVTATARGSINISAVKGFYLKSLPPLGWSVNRAGNYFRQGELLTLRFETVDGLTKMIVRLVPAKTKPSE